MKSNTQIKKATCCSRKQKILGAVALFGLFACGLMIGWTFNHGNTPQQTNSACTQIEIDLQKQLYSSDYTDFDDLYHNVRIYDKLMRYGCPENQLKWELAKEMEQDSKYVLRDKYDAKKIVKNSTCAQIEELLTNQLYPDDSQDPDFHIRNAKIYANLSERGCSENSQQYKELAKRELEIARALEDDKMTQQDTIEVVETYKRIQMQNAAQEILDKAKKITDPAIDFIIQLEKIINE